MTIAGGYTVQIGYKAEAAAPYGVLAAAGTYLPLGPIKSSPFSLGVPRADQRGLNSRVRLFKQPLDHIADLSVEVPLQTDSNWPLIQTIDDAAPIQYSLIIIITIGAVVYRVFGRGVYLEECTVSAERNAPIMAKITFSIGRWDGVYTAVTYGETDPTESTVVPQVWKDGKVTKVVASGWIDTGDVDMVDSWEITMKNNYKKKGSWSTLYPRDAQEEGFDVSGNITLDFEDILQLTELIGESEGDIDFFTEATDKITALDVTFDKIDIDFEELSLLMQKIPFTADDVSFTT